MNRKNFLIALAACGLAAPAAFLLPIASAQTAQSSVLAVGARAPLFTTTGALAGKSFQLDLAQQLKDGPVVLYFFPKAFTAGCTAETHEFAERSEDFEKLGAQVIGLSADDIPTLQRFSREACQDKFAVAHATPEMIKEYGVLLSPQSGVSSRTSFVVAPTGRIAFVHHDLDYRDHVRFTYEAVKSISARN